MNAFETLTPVIVIVWVVIPCVVLLILYSIIRRAVASGMRDHQKWMEKNRPWPTSIQGPPYQGAPQGPPRF